ncbi:hypothetical protein MFRU_003g03950 [Monilinia fructicola]|nr:hypothetical protein MFRU_003g03950 [Monilinia fructicola]
MRGCDFPGQTSLHERRAGRPPITQPPRAPRAAASPVETQRTPRYSFPRVFQSRCSISITVATTIPIPISTPTAAGSPMIKGREVHRALSSTPKCMCMYMRNCKCKYKCKSKSKSKFSPSTTPSTIQRKTSPPKPPNPQSANPNANQHPLTHPISASGPH